MPDSQPPVLIESFMGGAHPLRRPSSAPPPGASSDDGSKGAASSAGCGGTAQGGFVDEREERGVWYTPQDAPLDEEGEPS